MIIPLLAALVPSLIGLAEKAFSGPGKGSEKKQFVLEALAWIYDKFLASKIPDFPGVDERALFIEFGSFLIEFFVARTFNKKDAA